jgi:cobalamin biosynthesis protein CobD/CbiB
LLAWLLGDSVPGTGFFHPVVGMKNIIAFGLSYGINPMVQKYNHATAMGILAGIKRVFFCSVYQSICSIQW